MGKKTYVSLFSGCGGLDLGFTDAGFECLGAFDKDRKVVEVHKANIPSAKAVDADLSLGEMDALVPQSDLLVAGPPCQGFSTAGKMKEDDIRNSLLQVVVRVAKKTMPGIIVIENVPGLISKKMRHHYDKLIYDLSCSGYETRTITCDAHEYGVPQKRRRLFIIAWSDEYHLKRKLELSDLKERVTVTEALSDIAITAQNHAPKNLSASSSDYIIATHINAGQKLCDVRGGNHSVHTWDIPEVFGIISDEERQMLKLILSLRRKIRRRDFGDADPVLLSDIRKNISLTPDDIIASLVQKGYLRHKGDGIDLAYSFNGWYRRLDCNGYSPTVDTRFGRPKYFLHPTENRGLTVREAARLQTFPDTFVFSGTEAEQYRMVGNAVPPKIAKVIAKYVKSNLLDM